MHSNWFTITVPKDSEELKEELGRINLTLGHGKGCNGHCYSGYCGSCRGKKNYDRLELLALNYEKKIENDIQFVSISPPLQCGDVSWFELIGKMETYGDILEHLSLGIFYESYVLRSETRYRNAGELCDEIKKKYNIKLNRERIEHHLFNRERLNQIKSQLGHECDACYYECPDSVGLKMKVITSIPKIHKYTSHDEPCSKYEDAGFELDPEKTYVAFYWTR
uniref:Uncharacterized protein n=1 Tax=Pithovirus LCPAC404 TaxID=2506597 RepID=A0A481ZEK5_9VIRU|nr:MAG: hypothetical protein LCPAC404_03660 [Pithovirus LCPAC404]